MKSLIQNIPMAFLMVYGATGLKCSASSGTSNAASLEFQSEVAVPRENFQANGLTEHDTLGPNLAWIALGKQLIPEGRPLLDWERQDADEFFWSQFE
jgi:hypothetical protein